jgi:hypothetical protein
MTAPLRPAATKAYLRKKIILVTDPAYDPDAPSLAILNGASALDVTNMFFASSADPSQSTNMARAPKRVGDGVTYEFVGETQSSIGEVRYSMDPQGAALSDGVKCFEFLPEGTTGHYVVRWGIDRDVDLAVTTQRVTSRPFEAGPQLEVPEGDAEGAEVAIVQALAATGPQSMRKAIVA